jgi:branched-chain amino acid transport system substrate-binding protein
MLESGSIAPTTWRRAAFAGVVALVLLASACSSSSKSPAASQGDTSTTAATTGSTTTATTAVTLGTLHRAAGTPVKVGLLTTGGNCSGCTSNYEAPAARAAVAWLNDYNNGLAGHPMTLDVCVDNNDPGTGSDCANQMIRDNVVAVVIGANGILETEWKILHDAGVPVVNHSATQPALIQDPKSTFILYDPQAQTVTLPIAVAKHAGAKKVSFLVVDVPTATDIYKTDSTKRAFEDAGIKFDVIPVPLGQADLTPEAQQIVANNPDGVVDIIGSDVTCIPALNALHQLGFHGTVTTISYCITDAMRKAVPGNVVKGMRFGAEAPFGEASDPSLRQYAAIVDKYERGKVPHGDQPAITVFQSVAAVSIGAQDLKGAVTPASVTAAMKAMKNSVLPAAGGRIFRCNGKATSEGPAVCSVSTLTGTLDAKGNPTTYTLDNNDPIDG